MKPAAAIRDLEELHLLRRALTKAEEYQQGKITVAINFNQPVRSPAVSAKLNETAARVIKDALNTAQMREGITAILSARIAVLEAKYSGLVDGG